MGRDLAEILHREKRDDEAEATLNAIARLDPEPTHCLFQLYLLLKFSGKKEKARSVLDRMIAPIRERITREGSDALTHRKIALLLFLGDDKPGAVAEYREAARADPTDAECRRQLGRRLRMQGDLPGAIAAYRDSIRIDPMRVGAHYSLAELLEDSGDELGEIAELLEAVRAEGHDSGPYSPSRVSQYGSDVTFDDHEIDTLADGLADMHFMTRTAGPHVGYKLGSVHRLAGDKPGAITKYREAIAADPNSEIEARFGLVVTLGESGDFSGAIASFREAIDREHLGQAGRFCLLRAILMAERPDEAVVALRRVREQAGDDRTIKQSIDVGIREFEELAKSGREFREFFIFPQIQRLLWPANATSAGTSRPQQHSGPRVSRRTRSWPRT